MNMLAQTESPLTNTPAPQPLESGGWFAGFFDEHTLKVIGVLAAVALVTALVVWSSRRIGKWLRIPEHSWRLALIAWLLIAAAITISLKPLKFGVDLRGGVTIIGQLNQQKLEPGEEPVTIQSMIPRLKERIDPSSTQEIVIRALGDDKLEVIIPDVGKEEAERKWRLLTSAGHLLFRIVADENNPAHAALIQRAKDTMSERREDVMDGAGEKIGQWFLLSREQPRAGDSSGNLMPFKFLPGSNHLLRDVQTGEPIDIGGLRLAGDEEMARAQLSNWLERQGIVDVEILMAHPPERQNVEGRFLKGVRKGIDESAKPRIEFRLNSEGGKRMRALTTRNRPSGGLYSLLGIVLDDQLQAAPRINEPIYTNGVIEGQFTNEEVEAYRTVLKAGQLDVALRKNWISMDQILSTLGEELKVKGLTSIALSLGLVLVFMLFYYRFCGIVACLALTINLVLTVASLMLINASLTLTGLAGLVLTIGMSVDANVLVFERIREELERGSALRMAIRNGFDRATTTIIDSNVTTLLTAVILYVIGTEQLRGFAVTLIVGILMCMFTAIFVSRLMFTIAERNRWISVLNMNRIVSNRLIDFLKQRYVAGMASILLILVGLGAFFVRGHRILDTDLAGGSTARIEFVQETSVDNVRSKLEGANRTYEGDPIRYEVTQMKDNSLAFKIDSSLPVIEDENADQLTLDAIIEEVFAGELKMLGMSFDPDAIRIARGDGTPVEMNRGSPEVNDNPPPSGGGPNAGPIDRTGWYAESGQPLSPQENEPAPQDEGTEPADQENPPVSGEQPADPVNPPEQTPETEAGGENTQQPPAGRQPFTAETDLTFAFPMTGESVKGYLIDAAQSLGNVPLTERNIRLSAPDIDSLQDLSTQWHVVMDVYQPQDAERVLSSVRDTMAGQVYFASSSGVGGQVAGQTQWQAMIALLASLIMIVAYVWIRFQNVAFGLAAIVALVHDVLVVIGAIAMSYWLSGALGFLLVDDFRISLTVVAALLTIIGYSLNDTIVIFDRIREVRGKRNDITAEMINQSISQTLSRTILTSLTTLIVVTVLYILGGDSIHAFAFALLVGVVAGTYSTVFIASPVLLWLMNRGLAAPAVQPEKKPA